MSERMKALEEAGLLGCLNGTSTSSNWISVKEKMPIPPQNRYEELRHLVTDGKIVKEVSFVYWPPWTWILPSGMDAATHWMELPEPPKQD